VALIKHGGVMFDEKQTTLLHCPNSFTGVYKVPLTVTKIGIQAFFGCSRLLSVELPSGLKTINMLAFEGCRHLNSITIPASVECIDYRAFAKCNALTSIRLMHKIPPACSSNNSIFADTPVKFCRLYVPMGSGMAYSSAPVWKEFYEIIELVPDKEKAFENHKKALVG
jgi:hypothetical protein